MFCLVVDLTAQNKHFRHETNEKYNRNGSQNQSHFAVIFLLFWRHHVKDSKI
jgi:hypothetical protein